MNEARFNDPRVRGLVYQALLVAAVGLLVAGGAVNAYVNMQARGIPMGFGFWNQTAGFEINLHLIPYSGLSTYGQAFWVGLLNTLLVAAICIPLATLLGFAVGVARLSPNWLLSRSALLYTNILRNTPLLLLLLFWYNAVLKTLPGPRQSMSFGGLVFLNNRGLFLPGPVMLPGALAFFAAIALAAGRRPRASKLGAAAPGAHGRPAAGRARFGGVASRAAGDRRRRRRRALRDRRREAQRLQPEGRNSGHSRTGRARVRSRDLHRRASSRRSFAPASRPWRTARSRRPPRSGCIAGWRTGSSSSPRPCGSSFRR